MESLFNRIDPLQALLIVVGIIIIWTQLRSSVKFQGDWIAKHGAEWIEFRTRQQGINEKLTALVDTHCDRIDRIENWVDKQ